MRVAWPELIVLIFLAVFFTLVVEVLLLVAAKDYGVSGWIVAPGFFIGVFLDFWGLFRLLDWAFAGPARRARRRML
jgi:hypothetical protein